MSTNNKIETFGSGGGGYYRNIKFGIDTNHIYVGSDRNGISITKDGGNTWHYAWKDMIHMRVEAIAVPDGGSNIAIAATMGGLIKTTDGGDSWIRISDNIFTPKRDTNDTKIMFSAVAFNRVNSNKIYAGNGGYQPEQNKINPCKFYRTTDGGSSWNDITPSWSGDHSVYSIETDPNNENTIYVAGTFGLYKSTNNGNSWTQIYSKNTKGILVNPSNSNELLLIKGGDYYSSSSGQNVYKSTNGGSSWVQKTSGIASTYSFINQIVYNDGKVYGGIQNPNRGTSVQLYISSDFGETWVGKGFGWSDPPEWYESSLLSRIDVRNGHIVGTHANIIKSDDDGNNFYTIVSDKSTSNSGYWKGRGSEFWDVYQIAANPNNNNELYMAISDDRMAKSIDGGIYWKILEDEIGLPSSDDGSVTYNSGIATTVTPNGDIYISLFRSSHANMGVVLKSTDSGSTWSKVTGLPSDVSVWDLVSNSSGHIFAMVHYRGVYRSTNNGSSWAQVTSGPSGSGGVIAIHPNNDNIMYAATTIPGSGYNAEGIWKSTDGGSSWTRYGSTDLVHVTGISVYDNNVVYVSQHTNTPPGTKVGIWKSVDGGINWLRVLNPTVDADGLAIPSGYAVFAGVFVDPTNGFVYASANDLSPKSSNICRGQGLWKSEDEGNTWNVFETFGLTKSFNNNLHYIKDSRHLYLLSDQTTGYRIYLDQTSGGSSTPPNTITDNASNINESSATLNGQINPNGKSTTYYFEYGTTTSYGNTTSTKTLNNTGTSYVNVSESITSLNQDTSYHFRIVATNSDGTSYGLDKQFTTELGTQTMLPPTSIDATRLSNYIKISWYDNNTSNNLLTEGYNFDDPNDLNYWTERFAGTVSIENNKLKITDNGSSQWTPATRIVDSINIGEKYYFETYGYKGTADYVSLHVNDSTNSNVYIDLNLNNDGILSGTFTSNTNDVKIFLQIDNMDSGNYGYHDNVVLKKINSGYNYDGYELHYRPYDSSGNPTSGFSVLHSADSKFSEYYHTTANPQSDNYGYKVRYYTWNSGSKVYSDFTDEFILSDGVTYSTKSATNITNNSVTFNGEINPAGINTDYYFEYGTTISYGSTTPTQNAGSGTSTINVSSSVTGLNENTEYHYRLVILQ